MNTCGSCAYWQPEEREQIGSTLTYRKADPLCTLIRIKGKFKVKYAEDKPESWCHKEATPEQLASRIKAEIIDQAQLN